MSCSKVSSTLTDLVSRDGYDGAVVLGPGQPVQRASRGLAEQAHELVLAGGAEVLDRQ